MPPAGSSCFQTLRLRSEGFLNKSLIEPLEISLPNGSISVEPGTRFLKRSVAFRVLEARHPTR